MTGNAVLVTTLFSTTVSNWMLIHLFVCVCVSRRVPVHTFRVAVSSLPGNRLAGARRSLVADLGEKWASQWIRESSTKSRDPI